MALPQPIKTAAGTTPGVPNTAPINQGYTYDAAGDMVDSSGKVIMSAAQVQAYQQQYGLTPGDGAQTLLDKIANNPVVKEGAQVVGAPLVGGAQVISDTVNGKLGNIPGDLAYGGTGGIAGNNNGPTQGQFITPKTLGQAVDATGKVIDQAGTDIKTGATDVANALGGLGGGSTSIDTSGADAETARANALADALGGQATAAGDQANVDRGLGSQTRDQQEASIQGLTDAANGAVPSAAELALTRQSGIDASRQQGLAAALQGSNPAAALRQASMGAAKVAGDTAANAASLRATEQANARNALATTLGNVRSADQGNVTTDVGQQGTLTGAQVGSQGQGVTSTGQKLTAETEKAKADAIKQGALLQSAGTLGVGLLSDKRTKKNIAKASLADALGKGVHGVTFEYTDESGEAPGQHFGTLADELEKAIPGVVNKRGDGMRVVDTGHLTMANSAVLAELADRLMALEKKGGKR